MQAEPTIGAGETRDEAAAAAPDDFVWLWKIDLQSAYRFWHNHATELWMYGKQWGGAWFPRLPNTIRRCFHGAGFL